MPEVHAAAARSADTDALDEADAKAALLVRAFEAPFTPPWTEADAAWATREAQRLEGERVSPQRFIARRARLACERLTQRGVQARAARTGVMGWSAAAVLLAFGLGLFGDAVASAQRINILAPPLLALMAWNLAVYLALAVSALGRRRRHASGAVAERPLRQAALSLAQRLSTAALGRTRRPGASALARFAADWTQAARALHGARIAAVLHAAAAALALGALCSLYARGLAFEYRAGWDSTFLDADAVHRMVSFVLGPAAHLSGVALPDAARLAALRFSVGPGENAAAWIHLHAVTLSLIVLLPRLLMSAASAWRARRLRRRFPLSLADAYFRTLLRAQDGRALQVRVLPYSYHLASPLLPGLHAALQREFGPAVAVDLAETVPLGGEDGLRPMPSPSTRVALFALTATPEPENHGAFVRALRELHPDDTLLVLIDESGFRQRFTGADGAARLEQRRAAWQRMLHDVGDAPVFVDLARSPEAAADPIAKVRHDP